MGQRDIPGERAVSFFFCSVKVLVYFEANIARMSLRFTIVTNETKNILWYVGLIIICSILYGVKRPWRTVN